MLQYSFNKRKEDIIYYFVKNTDTCLKFKSINGSILKISYLNAIKELDYEYSIMIINYKINKNAVKLKIIFF